jgi:nitrate/TMAO reductase-like tetraheme cytochrome c subunit
LTPQKYFCNKCSYMGTVFMELEKEEETKETEE